MTDEEKIKLLADMFEVESDAITPETRLDSLIWDSVKRITFIVLVNDHSERTISVSQLKKASTVFDLLKVME